jgi:hypothetical protein
MSMVDRMAREYLAITKHLLEQPEPWIKNERLLVPRETLLELLNKYAYLDATNKLTLWRQLHWIDADPDHFTRLVRREDGSKLRAVALNLSVYKGLTEIRELPNE